MALKHATCNSFPWNKAGDFRTPILRPNMDTSKTEATRSGNARATLHPNKEILKLKKIPALKS